MAIWLVHAGARGEYEQKFIQKKRINDGKCLYVIPQGADLQAIRCAIR